TGPTKTSYLEGEAFDPTGITIDYVTTMGILEPRPWDGKTMEVQGYDSKKLGTQSLNLKFTADGHDYLVQDAFSVTVEKKIDFGIKLASGPKKVSYMQGEAFDPTGITIDFVGEDGKAISLQWDEKTMTIEGFDSSTAGTQKITINYTVDKKTYTAKDAFTVEVKAKDEPNKPVDPKPEDPSTPGTVTPIEKPEGDKTQTGDESKVGIMLVIMLASAGIGAGTILLKRKTKTNR
ncbi:MAG: bacterial Ig-like domain-containing protein, partial [Anaerovoracaceae bacterium]